MKHLIQIFAFILAFNSFSNGQTVETIATHSDIRDGMHTDESGNIYITSGGFAGFTIGKFEIESKDFIPSVFTGFYGPVDIDFYKDSLFVVTNYDNNTVSSYNIITGELKVITTGLDGPSGLVIDQDDNIYVASWGNAPSYAGQRIHKIDGESGNVELLVNSSILYRPQAMTINQSGEIIVYSKQKLYKMDAVTGALELWTNIGMKLGHMVFREKDNCIYGTAVDLHKIVKIDSQGNVSTIAGSSIGYEDGSASTARFTNPLGIEISPDQNTLYISEFGYGQGPGRLRSIDLNSVSSTQEVSELLLPIYPNPFQDFFYIDNKEGNDLTIKIYNDSGQLISEFQKNERNIKIDLFGYKQGSYLIKMTSEEHTISRALIKK